ncbi:hypothetical protein GGX14DRAFT_565310 [Mycena pura]|uniref:Uncharacterized protein n=1 Tax=Mycena pura TaxID=153505 RepID=A0AAD6YHQ1_9AGAR|nr:hypothetical protein GGX14DRAFT_565310 [Mycena pura]
MCAGRASRALYILYTSPPPVNTRRDTLRASRDGRCPHPYPTRAAARRLLSTHKTMLVARRVPSTESSLLVARRPPRAVSAPSARVHVQQHQPTAHFLLLVSRLPRATHCLHTARFPHRTPAARARCPLPAAGSGCLRAASRHMLPSTRCTLHAPPAHDSPRSFGPNPTTRRPPPATRHPLCARASYVPPGIVRTPTRPRYVSTQYGDGDATTYYCVHENNMAGVVRWSGRPAMLSAVEGSCTLCATFTLLQTPSAVATAGARDAPVWTRLKRVLSSERLLPHQRDLRASCLILGARPLLAGRHQSVAARGSPPAAFSSHKMPRATWQPLPASRETRSRSDPSDAAQRSLLQTKQLDC